MGVDNKTIAKNILKQLEKKEETQSQLAKALHVTRSTVSKWVTGTNSISLDAICSLAEHFNCSIDYLIHGDDKYAAPEFKKLELDYEVQEFYKRIKNKKSGKIAWTDALNFLISTDLMPGYDDAYYDDDTNSIDDRFIEAWATYLSIDMKDIPKGDNEPVLEIDDTYRKQKHTISYTSLETLQLCHLLNLLKEKKQKYMKTPKFKEIHERNITLEFLVQEEILAKHANKKPYITPSYSEGHKLGE